MEKVRYIELFSMKHSMAALPFSARVNDRKAEQISPPKRAKPAMLAAPSADDFRQFPPSVCRIIHILSFYFFYHIFPRYKSNALQNKAHKFTYFLP